MNVEDIQVILDSIRPSIQADGGDVEIIELTEDNVLKLRLLGHCVGCAYSQMTVKMGIERYLKEYFPELKSVEA
jgi:Fe-S cluster biogenesis protein NfuA